MKANTLLAQLTLAGLALLFSCHKEESSPVPEKYFPKVRSIVENHCTNMCHAPSKGFHNGMPVILETDDDIEAHASGIKASVADSITYFNKRMPAEGGLLSDSDVQLIVSWWEKGGKKTD